MKHIVVWSGGCDSTLILLDLIKKGVDVEVLVFDTNRFGDGKREYEENARFNILKTINKKIHINKISLDFSTDNVCGTGVHLFQQPCMIALTTIFGQCDSIFYFGYHKGDDFFAESHNILSGSQWLLISLGNKNIKFSFPLRYMTKDIIIGKLESLGMLDLCHWCEYPDDAIDNSGRCGKCTPCKTYSDSLDLLKKHRRNNTYNDIGLEYEYANLFNIEGWRDTKELVVDDIPKKVDTDICEINNKSKLIKNKKHHKKLTNKK